MGLWLKWLAKLLFKLKIYKGKKLKVIVPKKHIYTETDLDKNYFSNREIFLLPDKFEYINFGSDPHPVNNFWKKDTTYNEGDIVRTIIEHNEKQYTISYKSLANDNTDNFPPASPLHWIETHPELSDPYYMFDKYINTKSIADYRGIKLTYNLPRKSNEIVILGVENCMSFRYRFDEGEIITVKTKIHTAKSFMEYFFNGFYSKKDFIIEKPFIESSKLEIEFNDGTIIGSLLVAENSYDIGKALYGYKKQSRDFSKKQTTQSGLDYLQKGMQTKKYIVKLIIHNDEAPRVFDLLQSLSTTLCVYILEDGEFVFGWYKDLYMTKSNPVFSEYELEINGVI